MTKVEKLSNEIKEHFNIIQQLEIERRKICKHKNISKDEYRQDEWAFPNDYTITYKCKDCGLYSTSDINDDNFKKLNELYRKSK
jgi:hypothetical protein